MTREYIVPRGFEDDALGYLRPVYDRAVWRGGGGAVSRRTTQAQLARVVRGAPEVVVKVSGRIYAAPNFRRHLDYISRSGALALEGPDGELVATPRQVDDLAERWVFEARVANCGPIALSLVLSMPHGAPPLNVLTAASAFAEEMFKAERPYVLVLHEDQAHPHVHLTVHCLGRGAAKLHPGKAMLHLWRETFADHLRAVGVDAEASPRWARGVVQRRDRTPLYQMRERLLSGGGPVPDTLQAAVGHAKDAILGRWSEPAEHAAALALQADVRHRFSAEAAILRASSIAGERAFGEAATAFIGALPAPLTRHLMYVERLMEQSATRSVNSNKDHTTPPPMIRREVERSR